MPDRGSVLSPHWASSTAPDITSDKYFLEKVLETEIAWLDALASIGVSVQATKAKLSQFPVDEEFVLEISKTAWLSANPVVPAVERLKESLDNHAKAENALHKGLTSQDVLDCSMMLMAKTTLTQIELDLSKIGDVLKKLAVEHSETPCVTRTMNRYAEPSLLGFRFASWLEAVGQAKADIEITKRQIPAQMGGASGNRFGLLGFVNSNEIATLVESFADNLGLDVPKTSWHTNRIPVLRVANAIASASSVFTTLAKNLVNLGSPEVAEIVEKLEKGQGSSSSMPHKKNPTKSILAKSAGIRVPGVMAQIHASATSQDERGAGEWNAEWEPVRDLQRLVLGQANLVADVLEGMQVNVDAVGRNLQNSSLPQLRPTEEAKAYMQSEIKRITS